MTLFDIKKDIAICEDGGFFCVVCVVGKPKEEQSPDPRYCQGCYEVLLHEASMVTGHIKKSWIPKKAPQTSLRMLSSKAGKSKSGRLKTIPPP